MSNKLKPPKKYLQTVFENAYVQFMTITINVIYRINDWVTDSGATTLEDLLGRERKKAYDRKIRTGATSIFAELGKAEAYIKEMEYVWPEGKTATNIFRDVICVIRDWTEFSADFMTREWNPDNFLDRARTNTLIVKNRSFSNKYDQSLEAWENINHKIGVDFAEQGYCWEQNLDETKLRAI